MREETFDPARFTSESREAWSEAAAIYAEEHAPRLEPYGLRLLDHLELDAIPAGATVLDLACGPGDPALEIARRLAGRARVIATDLSPGMLAIARERAARAGLANLEFREADAQALPFPPETFERVSCRFGIMLMADPLAAALEAARVLLRGGFFGFTVWAESGRRSPLATHRIVMSEIVPPGMLPALPDLYALGSEAALRDLVERAGLEVSVIESVVHAFRYRDVDHYWKSVSRGGPVQRVLAGLPSDVVSRIEAETRVRIARTARAGGSIEHDSEALVVVGRM
jgi:ubiquinone/menaquinone biosynthesis C-methylase UbiE